MVKWLMMVICLFLTTVGGYAHAAETYVLTDLDKMYPYAVNRFGTVCGQYDGYPARIKAGGVIERLPGANFPGLCVGVNSYDQYVLYMWIGGEPKAYWYDGKLSKTVQPFKIPVGTRRSYVQSLNDGAVAGTPEVVGMSQADTSSCALRWTGLKSTPQCLPFDAAEFPNFAGINKHGKAVGSFVATAGETEVSFTHVRGAATITSVPSPGIYWAINDLGWLAGMGGIIRTAKGKDVVLEPWCPSGAGESASLDIYDLNDRVSAVGRTDCDTGTYAIQVNHSNTAPNWTFVDLNSVVNEPAWHLEQATAISKTNRIVGTGWNLQGERGWMLTPVAVVGQR
jgi:hypothetical protein